MNITFTYKTALLNILLLVISMNVYALEDKDKATDILSEVTKLIESSEYRQAYSLLKPHAEEFAGDAGFDYTFGLVALHAGKANEAVDYLARVVEIFPNHLMARFQLGLAYLSLNDKQNAKAQFEYLQTLNLPEPLAQNTNKYLTQIESAIKSDKSIYPFEFTGYIETGLGHDSNANSAINQSNIAVPALGAIINLPTDSQARKSNYYTTNLGFNLTKQITYDWLLYAGSDVKYRDYEIDDYSNTLTIARTGLIKLFGDNLIKFGVNGSYADFNSRNNHSLGGDLEYRHIFDEFNQIYSYANLTSYRFSKSIDSQDFDQSAIGLGYSRLSYEKNKSVSVGALFGYEDDVAGKTADNPKGGRIDGNQKYYGGVISGYYLPLANVKLSGSILYQHGDYSEQNILFLKNRSDRRLFLTLGVDYQMNNNWMLRTQMQHITVDSNIKIYDFDRNDMSVMLQYAFK